MALTAFDVVLQQWSDGDGGHDPAALTDQAFAAVAPPWTPRRGDPPR